MKFYIYFILICFHLRITASTINDTYDTVVSANLLNSSVEIASELSPAAVPPCICSVFLSGQVTKGKPPRGNPALMHEMEDQCFCGPIGIKQCTNKCLEALVKHLPNSPGLICGSIDRDCHKERAYLFVKNCNGSWTNTNLSAGREYCCKDGISYKCPSLLSH